MWYSNLTRVGNIGSAAIFVILDEMMTEGLINPGDTLLCMVPESGRFVVSFMHLTAGHCQLEQSEGDFRRFVSAIHQVACDV